MPLSPLAMKAAIRGPLFLASIPNSYAPSVIALRFDCKDTAEGAFCIRTCRFTIGDHSLL